MPADRAEIASAELAVREQVARYEQAYGPLGTSTLSTDRAPLDQMMGVAHVVDVRPLRGKATFSEGKPAGPVISREFLEAHAATRPFRPGEVVLFQSGYSDERFKPLLLKPQQLQLYLCLLRFSTLLDFLIYPLLLCVLLSTQQKCRPLY